MVSNSPDPTTPVLPLEIKKNNIKDTARNVASFAASLTRFVLFFGSTGVGKTTALPYYLASVLGSILVLVDDEQLVTSLTNYMSKAPRVKYMTKLKYILTRPTGPVLVDEYHKPDHLTHHIVDHLQHPSTCFLTSATSMEAIADTTTTLFSITDVFDPRYTLENIYKCLPLPYLEPTTSGFRTLVFAPNDTDAIALSRKYSGLPVFNVTTSNIDTQVPIINATTGPILVFASPVIQTGHTLDLDVVIDLVLSQCVEFSSSSPLSHINVKRGPSTQLECVQRRGRVGRLKRGIYIYSSKNFSKSTKIHPYFREFYQRLSTGLTPKLHMQLVLGYHPTVTDPILNDNGTFKYKCRLASYYSQNPTSAGPSIKAGHHFVITSVWDHTFNVTAQINHFETLN
uniref:Helicase n=1 Tax=Chara australis virus TaxID=1051671 RepID=F8ULT6_9VIRU|nr:helicase [Chara australis virus]